MKEHDFWLLFENHLRTSSKARLPKGWNHRCAELAGILFGQVGCLTLCHLSIMRNKFRLVIPIEIDIGN